MKKITPAPLRQKVQVRFPDGRAFDGPVGTTAEAFIHAAKPECDGYIVAAMINHRLRELTMPIEQDSDIVPVTTTSSDGGRIYRRSLSFLMIAAAADIFPDDDIIIQHSMPFGGYFCERSDGIPLQKSELAALKARMVELVADDLPFVQVRLPLELALPQFLANGDKDKAALFSRRRKDYLTLYELNNVLDYFHGFMVPRTGYLALFDLHPYANGFILQFPRRHAPDVLQPFSDEPRLATVFQEYSKWLSVMGVARVAQLNQAIADGRGKESVLIAEALHRRQTTSIAATIAARFPKVRLVLISGPTSAGKTTFSKRLAIQLLAQGIHPLALGLDNYFVNRIDTPLDEDGEYDFEALSAVDLPLFQKHLRQMLAGESVVQPIYDFITGERKWGEPLQLRDDQILLIEGIHGLNPLLVTGVPETAMYRIFISAFTQLNLDRHNRIPTTDTRLLRRIVRDAAHRGYSAAATIRRWPSVRRGEKRWIFPHQNNADVFFNSALVYELAALKPLVYPLLLQVEPDTAERVEANRLLASLQWFDPIDQSYIPNDSLLREFIGGSVLDDFEPW